MTTSASSSPPSPPFAGKKEVALKELMDCHLLLTHNFPSPQEKPIGHVLHRFRRFTVLSGLESAKRILTENPDMIMIAPSFSVFQDHLVNTGRLATVPITGFDTALTIFMMCDICSSFSTQEVMLIREIRNFFQNLK